MRKILSCVFKECMDFAHLLPDTICDVATEQGFDPTGRLYPLNSYENRVYQIELENEDPIIAKFYRPHRWSINAICDEHRFLYALEDAEIPVVKSLSLKNPVPEFESVGQMGDMFYAFFPRFRGREHAELNLEDRQWLGRSLARLHNVGEHFSVNDRITLDPQTYGFDNLEFILDQGFVPEDLKDNLETFIVLSLELIEPYFSRIQKTIAIHGDCHLGNVLWNIDGPHLVDFDDMVLASPVQDVWMLFHGDEDEVHEQKEAFFEGYELFREFDHSSFILTEPLRTLRMIRHAAWIGHRYAEEIFKRTFPYYNDRKYWEEFLLSIKEQISLLQEI